MVGAVVVDGDREVAVGHHATFGAAHAEIAALGKADPAGRGASLYVTLEPCCHYGKTPPCTDAILSAGIARVVAAMSDPFPKVDGGGLRRLREAGIATEVGVLEAESRVLNAPYLKLLATGRPFVTAKWAMTLDGRIATASGSSRWISGPRSRAAVHELRGRMDAILVGIGTVLADDPSLTVRPPGPRRPARVILDSRAKLPLNSALVASANEIPCLVAVTSRAPQDRRSALEDRGCQILPYDLQNSVPIGPLLDDLGRMGMTNLLVEGGGRVLGSFLDIGEIDAIDVFLAPKIEGGQPVHVPFAGNGVALMTLAQRLERHEVTVLDGDIRISGILPRRWETERASVIP